MGNWGEGAAELPASRGRASPRFRWPSPVSKLTTLIPDKKPAGAVRAEVPRPKGNRQPVHLCFLLRAMGSHQRVLRDVGSCTGSSCLLCPVSLMSLRNPFSGMVFYFQHFQLLLNWITVVTQEPNTSQGPRVVSSLGGFLRKYIAFCCCCCWELGERQAWFRGTGERGEAELLSFYAPVVLQTLKQGAWHWKWCCLKVSGQDLLRNGLWR